MVVCDSGPIVHLSRVGKLELLKELFSSVVKELFSSVEIPLSVYREVVEEAKALGKRGVNAIEMAIKDGWIKTVELGERDPVGKLAKAESIQLEDAEVVYLAKKRSASLVTNDGWLIAVARSLGIRTLWTTTLILLAIKRGKISKKEGKELLRELVLSGLYIRPDIYATLLHAIDELG